MRPTCLKTNRITLISNLLCIICMPLTAYNKKAVKWFLLELCPRKTHAKLFVFLLDCGELHLHSKEPLLSSGAGDDAVSADGWGGGGRLTGQRVAQQRGGLQLLGQKEEEEEKQHAGGFRELLFKQYFLKPCRFVNMWKHCACCFSGTVWGPSPGSPSLLKGLRCCGTRQWLNPTWPCWLKAPIRPLWRVLPGLYRTCQLGTGRYINIHLHLYTHSFTFSIGDTLESLYLFNCFKKIWQFTCSPTAKANVDFTLEITHANVGIRRRAFFRCGIPALVKF